MRTSYWRVSCALMVLQAAGATQASWVQVSSVGPPARWTHTMTYDSARGRTLVFGGSTGGTGPGTICLGDTWEWDGTSWSLVVVTGPTARSMAAIAYDSQRSRAVRFGGFDSIAELGDTWEWDGHQWTARFVAGPSARLGHAMAYDSQRGKTVLFAGSGDPSGPNGLSGDTWEWDGTSWSQVGTTGAPPRLAHAMAYDSLRGRTVMFGSANAPSNTNDTWEWDGTHWALVAVGPQSPPLRYFHAMAFDAGRGRTVVFGGVSNSGFALDDMWDWDGVAWRQVVSQGPEARLGHGMVGDLMRGGIVLFGGSNNLPNTLPSPIGDTWECQVAPNIPSVATAYGTGCGPGPFSVFPVVASPPAIGSTAQAAFTGIPATAAFVALGWSRTLVGPFALPFSLASYNMPGCYLLQSSEAAAQTVTLTGGGNGVYGLPLPFWPGLIGLHVYLQGWAPAPGANAGGVIVSTGLDWLIGY